MELNKNVPAIRFKGFSKEWQMEQLKEFSSYRSSNLSASNAYDKGAYKVYDANQCIGYTNRRLMKDDYITIIKDGSGVGRVRILKGNSSFIATMGAITNENSDLYFLYNILLKTDFNKHITGATIPHIYYSVYGNEEYHIPKEPEQTQIGNFFKTLDSQITSQEQKNQKLVNLKKAMLEKMFPKEGADVPEIRFKGFEEKWEEKKLGEIGVFKNGMNFGKEALNLGYPFINLQNVFGKKYVEKKDLGLAISNDSQRKDYNILKGDILFVRSSVKLEGVGQVSVVKESMDNTTFSGFIIRYRLITKLDIKFSAIVFSNSFIRNQILKTASSSANTNINQESLKNIILLIPRIEEQQKIGEYFEKLDNLIQQSQEQIKKYKNIKQALLQKMFV